MALGLLTSPVLTQKARTARGHLIVNGVDLLAGVSAEHIMDFSYTDSTSDKADDLSIRIRDPHRNWMLRYLSGEAKAGIECSASISITDWSAPEDSRTLECGIFWINHIGFGYTCDVDIKASSIPPNGAKNTKKHRAWEGSSIKSIGEQIASDNGLTLFYDTQTNPRAKRAEQKEKSDIEYLRTLCKELKLSLKIHKKQLVIYSEEEYEARDAVFELKWGAKNILGFSFDWKVDDAFKKCECAYVNPETGRITKEEFEDSSALEDCDQEVLSRSILKTNECLYYDPRGTGGAAGFLMPYVDMEDVRKNDWDDAPGSNKGKGNGAKAKAKGKAQAKLREKNKKVKECSFKVFGNIDYISGLCFSTSGFGVFDRKWFIETSTHCIGGGGYTTDLKCRHTLTGY